MSLLVLDPDIADQDSTGAQLVKRFTELQFITFDTPDPRTAASLCRQGNVDLLFCCDRQSLAALDDIQAGVGLVVVADVIPESEDLLAMMRGGALDVLLWPAEAAHLRERVGLLLARIERQVADLNAQVGHLRSELERDQRAGQYIQMGMLPPNPMGIGHLRLQHRVVPSLILSGDFVDYFQISDRYAACYVADVAGHGASSAFVTVLLKNFSRRLRREYRVTMLSNPGEILAWINGELLDQGIDKHVAMFFAIIDMQDHQLHYANAAHLPPAALLVDGELTFLEQKAKPLGLFPDLEYASLTVPFPYGAKLVVFSDGVFDLLADAPITDKEQTLGEAIKSSSDMDSLWSIFDPNLVGPDDVSCLMVQHGV